MGRRELLLPGSISYTAWRREKLSWRWTLQVAKLWPNVGLQSSKRGWCVLLQKLGYWSANCIVCCEVMSMKRLFMMQWLTDTQEVPPFSLHCSLMAKSSVRPSCQAEMSWFSLGRMGSVWVISGRPWINLIVSTYETNAGKRLRLFAS